MRDIDKRLRMLERQPQRGTIEDLFDDRLMGLEANGEEAAGVELLKRKEARDRLIPFCQYTMPSYEAAAHLVALADKLEAVERGEIKRLIVLMPPRHGKSELISIRFPCWYLAKHPESYVVQAGYAENIALVHSRMARDVFVSPELRRLFPSIHHRPERAGQEMILPERQAAHEWGTKQGGSYYAVGIGGSLTGRGFNVAVIDDPVKDVEEAESKVMRDKVWDWYRTVFRTRAQPDAAIIIVMTRWHQDDLVGRLIKQAQEDSGSDQWDIVHFKALDDGQALWPERYPLDVLEIIRSSIGSRAFTSLYYGEPTIAEGNIIKREWWRYYKEQPQFNRIIHSFDTAFKAKSSNDYSVCTVWGETQNAYYLIDVWRGRAEFPELKRIAEALFERDKPVAVLVEDAASGQSLIQEFQRDTRIPLLPVKVGGDKVVRAYAATPLIEAGRVYLPEGASWLYDYVEELSAFPAGQFDDQVDSTTQALNWLNARPIETETIVYFDAFKEFAAELGDFELRI